MESNEEKTNPSKNSHPHSLLRKFRPKNSAPVSSPIPLNLPDSHDFFNCHSCGIQNGELQTLDSQWRIVLLCPDCLNRIRSASVCSYCFKTRDFDVLVCSSCSCLVHLSCVSTQRGFITISEFDPVSFTCIDCCAIPGMRFGDPRISRVVLENLVRNSSSDAKMKVSMADRARLKALKKADEARVAMELAFDAMSFARDAEFDDEELCIDMHRVVNSSRQAKLDQYFRGKKDWGAEDCDLLIRTLKKRKRRIHDENVGICCNIDEAVLDSSNSLLSERNSCVKPGYESSSMEVDLILGKKKRRHHDVVDNNGLTLISCRQSADSNSFCGGI